MASTGSATEEQAQPPRGFSTTICCYSITSTGSATEEQALK